MLPQDSHIVIATRNRGKMLEFQEMLAPLGIRVSCLLDVEKNTIPEIEEDGETFAANAEKKARMAASVMGMPVLADDSGLCVEALGGEPGVKSARYAGEPSSDVANNTKLLRELADRTEGYIDLEGNFIWSQARFMCALVLFQPTTGIALHAEGACEGQIIGEARGTHGFGYDPLFYIPEFKRTFAELAPHEKHQISHRGRALQSFIDVISRGRLQ